MFCYFMLCLHCIIWYYITLHYITLHYIILYYIILYYIILYYIILYYIILYYIIVEERVEKGNGLFTGVTLGFFLFSVSVGALSSFETSGTIDRATQTLEPTQPQLWIVSYFVMFICLYDFCNKHAYRPTQLNVCCGKMFRSNAVMFSP